MDTDRGGGGFKSYKIFLTWAHFVLGPAIINDLRMWRRNVDWFRYKLYARILYRVRGSKCVYWVLVINAFPCDG